MKMTERRQVKVGLIGLGLMGREFASASARWCHLLDDGPVPVIAAICDSDKAAWEWFLDSFPAIELVTADYTELLASESVDMVYCAVPHNLHEQVYVDTLKAGKHLLGEKPFGIDKEANDRILEAVADHPELVVRCSSEFPYFPAAQRLIQWIRGKGPGRLMEVRVGFHHSSDMDLEKPINWKRMVEVNGEYGAMGDLGMHVLHIPYRMGWFPHSVYADLLKIAQTRPDGKGEEVPCETWDNATLICRANDPATGQEFSLTAETKRMAPGQTNTWFIEVYGTRGSARFSTRQPKSFYYLETKGGEQSWSRLDVGSRSSLPSITGGIFEVGFSDALQQMIGAFMQELRPEGSNHPFGPVTPQETALSHKLFTAALESNRTGRCVSVDED